MLDHDLRVISVCKVNSLGCGKDDFAISSIADMSMHKNTIRDHRLLTLFFLLLWFFSVSVLQAKETALPKMSVSKTSWKVLFIGVERESNKSQNLLSLAVKLSNVLAQFASKLEFHELDNNEKLELRKDSVRNAMFPLYTAYNKLVDERERVPFMEGSKKRKYLQTLKGGKIETKIAKQEKLIKKGLAVDPMDLSVPDRLALEVVDESDSAFQVLNLAYAKHKYDVAVWVSVKSRASVMLLSLKAKTGLTNKDIVLWEGTVQSENFTNISTILRDRLTSLLLGRPWASLRIEANTSTGVEPSIYIDGKLQGKNQVELYGLTPKRIYDLEVRAPGFQSKRELIALKASGQSIFNYNLTTPVPEKTIEITTSVPAEIYLGVRYEGTTPLTIKVPERETLLVVSAKGRETINLTLKPQDAEDLYFEMKEAGLLTLEEEYEKRQRRFYMSSGLFLMSLFIPVISLGVYSTNNALNGYNGGRIPRFAEGTRNGLIGLGVGIGISLGTLGLNIFDFVKYTQAARGLAKITVGEKNQ